MSPRSEGTEPMRHRKARHTCTRVGRFTTHDRESGPDMTLVLVTGAGASANLGLKNQPIAQMADWCSYLCHRLRPFQREMLGIEDGMNGPDFEARIGEFLAMRRNLSAVARFPSAGASERFSVEMATEWF